ncbi:MAG: nucleotidyltransferase family protein [Blastocatellia bacterium]
MIPQIPVETYEKIVQLCMKYKVRELSLFGSRARGNFSDSSDFDFLIDFAPDAKIDLFDFSNIQVDLEDLLHAEVDLVPKKDLRPSFRQSVLADAVILYEK